MARSKAVVDNRVFPFSYSTLFVRVASTFTRLTRLTSSGRPDAIVDMSPAFKIATRQVDVASKREAVLALQSMARQSESDKNLPPVEFALRYGVVPPVLAGRAKEMAILEQLVEGIQAGKGDQSLLGLHGI